MSNNTIGRAMFGVTLALALLLFFLPSVESAKLYGTIYDLSLERVPDVIVAINSTPIQRDISEDGTYSFTLSPGEYLLIANQVQLNRSVASAKEKISIVEDGEYNLDLFLFPNLDEEQSLIDGSGVDIPKDEGISKASMAFLIVGGIIGLLLIVFSALFLLRLKRGKDVNSHTSPDSESIANDAPTKENGKVGIEQSEKQKQTSGVADGSTLSGSIANPAEPIEGDYLQEVLAFLKEEGGRTTQKDIRKKIPLSEAKISLIITELEAKGIIEKIKKGRANIIILKR